VVSSRVRYGSAACWDSRSSFPGPALGVDRHACGAGIGDNLIKRKYNLLLRACYSIQMICLDGYRLCNVGSDVVVTVRRMNEDILNSHLCC
jgi:hypothetical protein